MANIANTNYDPLELLHLKTSVYQYLLERHLNTQSSPLLRECMLRYTYGLNTLQGLVTTAS